ncbi:MAG: cation:proton antiporter [Thermoplasmata archaeon]
MVDTTTLFIVGLFLLVACSVLVGELFTHLGQAALVGQLLVGVALGPTLLGPSLGLTAITSELSGLETLATFFILLMAGLSVSPEQIWSTGRSAALLGLSIFFIPFLGGAAVVALLYPGVGTSLDLFIALTISITALPVLGVMLREFGLMKSRFGTLMLNASVVNELAAVTVFAILLRVYTGGGNDVTAITLSVGTVGIFLGVILAIHFLLRSLRENRIWERVARGFRRAWRSREAGFALVVVLGLASALFSQYLGLTFIVGAFYAGMLITPESAGKKLHRNISQMFDAVSWGFFIPLFFALVGFGTDFRSLEGSWTAIAAFGALVVYALTAKFIVGTGFARLVGLSPNGSYAAGFLLTSRGAVELAMAVILLDIHIFTTTLFTIVAGVGLITTIISPIGARPFIRASALDRPSSGEFTAAPQPEEVSPPFVLPEVDDSPLI